MSKDTDVKAYIWHPITKRWESCQKIQTYYGGGNTIPMGIFSDSTSEGIIIQSALTYLMMNDSNYFGGSFPVFHVGGPSNTGDLTQGRLAIIMEYKPKTQNI